MTDAPSDRPEARPRVVLGVAGGIAAYKACELVRLLRKRGHAVGSSKVGGTRRYRIEGASQ